MKKTIYHTTLAILLLCTTILVGATGDHQELLQKAQHIIEEQTPCNELTETDLEALGEYFMEQMHPGEAHERMDEMMGGEGSETLRQAHINMGTNFYCRNTGDTNTQINIENQEWNNMMRSRNNNYNHMNWTWNGIMIQPLLLIILIILLILLIKINTKNNKK